MGPAQGMSDNIRAADVALAAITSGSCFPSEERTLAVTYIPIPGKTHSETTFQEQFRQMSAHQIQ